MQAIRCLLVVASIALSFLIQAQDQTDEIDLTFIEDFISEELEELVDIPLEDIYDYLVNLQKNPININKARHDDFKEIIFLSDQDILKIINHRKRYGDFISVLELQTIPGFSVELIRGLEPFIHVGGSEEVFQVGLWDMLSKGRNELFLRYGQTLETQAGFEIDPSEGRSYYTGGPSKLYTRYRHQYENKLTYGFTLEKDPGEEFFTGSNPSGFDFASFHLAIRNINQNIKYLTLGDFSMSLGQGLIYYSRFVNRKSSLVTNIKRKGSVFHPYTSLNEFNFMRGAAVTLRLSEQIDFSAFYSRRKLDASIRDFDENDPTEISSIRESGLHRTPSEILNEKILGRTTYGGILKYYFTHGIIGIQAINYHLDKNLVPAERLYSRFNFSGDQLTNLSADYELTINNIHVFGEIGWATSLGMVHGALISLSRNADLSLIYRNLPADFQTFHGNTFAETSTNSNEEGMFIGFSLRPHKRWSWNTYFDLFKHPWLKFRVNKPSTGQEALSRITYTIKRKLQSYFQYKIETKERNAVGSNDKVIPIHRYYKQNFRLHTGYHIDPDFEYRFRAEYVSWKEKEKEINKNGFLIYHDLIFKPIGKPFSFTARLAYFNTEDFDTRLYAYENDLTYNYGIPAYYNRGWRYYLNTRYKFRNVSLEARLSRTTLNDQNTIGSGLNEIDGNKRTDIKLQARLSF